jgi:hypothetical protein
VITASIHIIINIHIDSMGIIVCIIVTSVIVIDILVTSDISPARIAPVVIDVIV